VGWFFVVKLFVIAFWLGKMLAIHFLIQQFLDNLIEAVWVIE
jgi:hypothetical protein